MPGVCPRRKIPDFLGPDLHPAPPNDDVFPSAWPSWLSFTPATTPLQRRSRGMSTDVQGRLQEDLQDNSKKTPRKLRHHTPGGAVASERICSFATAARACSARDNRKEQKGSNKAAWHFDLLRAPGPTGHSAHRFLRRRSREHVTTIRTGARQARRRRRQMA
jgi:hypothetical protein